MKLPHRVYYVVVITRYFPTKDNAKNIYTWRQRYLGKDPEISAIGVEDFEYRMKIKIADLGQTG